MQTYEEIDPYAVLGLPPGAPAHEVKAQFRLLAKRFHPDLNPGSEWHQEQFRRIHTAYEVIEHAHRTDTSNAAHGEQTTPKSDASPGHSSEAAWVHVGGASYVSGSPFASETATAHRRRSLGWRMRHFPQAGLITGGLAVVALLLIVFVMAEPHSHDAYATSSIALNASLPLATPDVLPSGGFLNTGVSADAGYQSTGVTSVTQSGTYDSPAPTGDVPSGTSSARFSVDTKYTQIDPTYTAVDPQYTTVNVQASGDAQAIGVDPKNTRIDPQMIRP